MHRNPTDTTVPTSSGARARVVAAVAGTTGLAVLAGCGSSATPSRPAPDPTGTAAATGGLHVARTSLGDVLVDGGGRTVYTLSADKHGRSTCSSACVAVWPPVGPTSAASGVTGTVARTTTPGGGAIATIGGAPLYTYSGDHAAGDVRGEGVHSFGGEWYAVSPSGATVKAGGGGSSDSGGGYGY